MTSSLKYYDTNKLSFPSEFVRYKLPYRLVEEVTDDNVDDFLNGWRDNKVRALVFQRTAPLRLRYLLTAYFHRDRVAFGCV